MSLAEIGAEYGLSDDGTLIAAKRPINYIYDAHDMLLQF